MCILRWFPYLWEENGDNKVVDEECFWCVAVVIFKEEDSEGDDEVLLRCITERKSQQLHRTHHKKERAHTVEERTRILNCHRFVFKCICYQQNRNFTGKSLHTVTKPFVFKQKEFQENECCIFLISIFIWFSSSYSLGAKFTDDIGTGLCQGTQDDRRIEDVPLKESQPHVHLLKPHDLRGH